MSLIMMLLTREGTLLEPVFELLLNSTANIKFWCLSVSCCCITSHTEINNLNNKCISRESDWMSGWLVELSWACSCICDQLASQMGLTGLEEPQLKWLFCSMCVFSFFSSTLVQLCSHGGRKSLREKWKCVRSSETWNGYTITSVTVFWPEQTPRPAQISG